MGKRGPGAGRLRAAAAGAPVAAPDWSGSLFQDYAPPAPAIVAHPWEQDGMPAAEKMLAFLRTLPIVSDLRAGEPMELLDFQKRFVRGVYAETAGERLVRLAGLSVARGNGESALLAGLRLAHLLGPMKGPYGECYAAALDREQAGVIATVEGWDFSLGYPIPDRTKLDVLQHVMNAFGGSGSIDVPPTRSAC
jgi:hypothetical protein